MKFMNNSEELLLRRVRKDKNIILLNSQRLL